MHRHSGYAACPQLPQDDCAWGEALRPRAHTARDAAITRQILLATIPETFMTSRHTLASMRRIGFSAALALFVLPAFVHAQALDDFRSVASGNWGAAATWQLFDGTNWVAAAAPPTSSDGVITIQSGHTVTVATAVVVDQVVVDAGGQITLGSGVTLTLANGTGTDLTVNGILKNAGAVSIA